MKSVHFGWIEGAIRYAGRFGTREKEAYRELFAVSEPTASRHQAEFATAFETACEREIFERAAGDRFKGGGLHLRGDAVLPEAPVFKRVPSVERWLQDAFENRHYFEEGIGRAEPYPDVTRAIIRAIEDEHPLRMTYHGRRGETSRTISPHVIVKVAGRMHVRAWDHDRNGFRDFVMTRIVTIRHASAVEAGYVGNARDTEWTNRTSVEIACAKNCDPAARDGIRRDFGLDTEGRRTQQVRRALVPYLVDETGEGFSSPVTVRGSA